MAKHPLTIRDTTIFDGIIAKYFLKSIFILWFKIAGWQVTKTTPKGAGVAIAAPHTSNWDFVYALGAAIIQDVKIYFSIKDSWCKKPVIGRLMMWLGAMPIDRSSKGQGQVDVIKQFVSRHKSAKVFFLFTPEGTRGKAQKWKTGFYHVAQGCGIPIFLAKVDYLLKEAGVFHSYQLTDNKDDDISAMQASYKRVAGKYTDKQFPEYMGALPTFSDSETKLMEAIYSLKGMATKVELTAKMKKQQISTALLDFLIEKGIVEQLNQQDNQEPSYGLTFIGKGCLLHLRPTLAS
ncbi:1-acyl-sn-glycerol-3-phosphate acyltransferase [Thalassotalea sp. G2M2-11]|uniref:1-acyl-sn-glycerol-3-phosphate acyltransferase n=1 Tax=Thalassotalea sp. G2M2-11 TaxID=2787627 RepID=UPI0019D087C7|nr:1-acyl-sn-glycerol-3-phosphate acyltransferase [Thalassotalea sp. G2M2-11]